MLGAMFGCNGPSGSGVDGFFKGVYFHILAIIFLWKRAKQFIWPTWIPFTQKCFKVYDNDNNNDDKFWSVRKSWT